MNVIHLQPWEEYVGKLVKVENKNGYGYLYFHNGGIIAVPSKFAINLVNKIGRRIAVLRTDLPNKLYLWREENVEPR